MRWTPGRAAVQATAVAGSGMRNLCRDTCPGWATTDEPLASPSPARPASSAVASPGDWPQPESASGCIVRSPNRTPAMPGAQVAVASYGDVGSRRGRPDRHRHAVHGVRCPRIRTGCADHLTFVDAAAGPRVSDGSSTPRSSDASPDSTFLLARDHWYTETADPGTGSGTSRFCATTSTPTSSSTSPGRRGCSAGRPVTAEWPPSPGRTSSTWPSRCCRPRRCRRPRPSTTE